MRPIAHSHAMLGVLMKSVMVGRMLFTVTNISDVEGFICHNRISTLQKKPLHTIFYRSEPMRQTLNLGHTYILECGCNKYCDLIDQLAVHYFT